MMRLGLILAAFLGSAATAVPASADITYTLNCNASPCTTAQTGNYGSVTLHQNGSGSSSYVTVTVDLSTAAVQPTFYAGTGAGYAITWDIRGDASNPLAPNNPSLSAVTINTVLTPNSSNFQVQNFTSGQGYKASPFTSGNCPGSSDCFNYAIDYLPNGGAGSDFKLVFDVSAAGGVVLNNFVANPNGAVFTADISQSGKTFVVGGNQVATTRTPEPQTWALFFAGLTGLTLLQRRRKEAKAA